MTLYSYVVARDYGFAPNPFFGMCTLATCKPLIRRSAKVRDWIVGTGSKTHNRNGYLVYAMKVDEVLSFDKYWDDKRFQTKKPTFLGSKKAAYGDNIYHHSKKKEWIQSNSHHSYSDGKCNPHNIENDTQTDRVLVGANFCYWGRSGPRLPSSLLKICAGRGHKCNFPPTLVDSFVAWIDTLDKGYLGAPEDWR